MALPSHGPRPSHGPAPGPSPGPRTPIRPGLTEITRTYARIAALSFGGPAGQIAVMHRILVEERRWLDEARFLHALNFCMLLPGPEAQQLAIYSGWLAGGVRAGLIAGLLFIAPGFAAIMALSVIYVTWGDVPAVQGLLFGIKAAVLAIVAGAVVRLAGRALQHRWQWLIAVAGFVLIFAFGVPFPLIVLGAGVAGWLTGRASPAAAPAAEAPAGDARGAMRAGLIALALWLVPWTLLTLALPGSIWAEVAGFFSRMAVVTFGGAYAALAYVAQEAVGRFGWLAPGEMLDSLGLAETTPGPLIMVLQFVGFLAAFRDPGALPPLLAGALGGVLTTWVTFAPCFAWIFLGAPFVERLRGHAGLAAALSGVTAAVVGVIANLALWFGLHLLFRQTADWTAGPLHLTLPRLGSLDPAAALLAGAALLAVLRWRVPIAPLLAGTALAGLALRLAGGA